MDRYQLVPTFDCDFDYYDDIDRKFTDQDSGIFWNPTEACSSTIYDDPEGDGRSSRTNFRSDDDDYCEPVYFPKRYGIDTRSRLDEDEVHSGYYHVTDENSGRHEQAGRSMTSTVNGVSGSSSGTSQSSSSYTGATGGNSTTSFKDPRLSELSYFDDSDSDDEGVLRGVGGRTLDTISEEDEHDLQELDDDVGDSRSCSSDDHDEQNRGSQRHRGPVFDVDGSSFSETEDMHVNSNGSIVFDWLSRSWIAAGSSNTEKGSLNSPNRHDVPKPGTVLHEQLPVFHSAASDLVELRDKGTVDGLQHITPFPILSKLATGNSDNDNDTMTSSYGDDSSATDKHTRLTFKLVGFDVPQNFEQEVKLSEWWTRTSTSDSGSSGVVVAGDPVTAGSACGPMDDMVAGPLLSSTPPPELGIASNMEDSFRSLTSDFDIRPGDHESKNSIEVFIDAVDDGKLHEIDRCMNRPSMADFTDCGDIINSNIGLHVAITIEQHFDCSKSSGKSDDVELTQPDNEVCAQVPAAHDDVTPPHAADPLSTTLITDAPTTRTGQLANSSKCVESEHQVDEIKSTTAEDVVQDNENYSNEELVLAVSVSRSNHYPECTTVSQKTSLTSSTSDRQSIVFKHIPPRHLPQHQQASDHHDNVTPADDRDVKTEYAAGTVPTGSRRQSAASRRSQFLIVDIDIGEGVSSPAMIQPPVRQPSAPDEVKKRAESRDRLNELKRRLTEARPVAPSASVDENTWNSEVACKWSQTHRRSSRSISGSQSTLFTPTDVKIDEQLKRTRSAHCLMLSPLSIAPRYSDNGSALPLSPDAIGAMDDLCTDDPWRQNLSSSSDLVGGMRSADCFDDERSRSLSDLTAMVDRKQRLFEMPSIDFVVSVTREPVKRVVDDEFAREQHDLSKTELWMRKSLERLDLPSWCRNSPRFHQEVVALRHAKSTDLGKVHSNVGSNISKDGLSVSKSTRETVTSANNALGCPGVPSRRVNAPQAISSGPTSAGGAGMAAGFRLPSEILLERWTKPRYSTIDTKSFEDVMKSFETETRKKTSAADDLSTLGLSDRPTLERLERWPSPEQLDIARDMLIVNNRIDIAKVNQSVTEVEKDYDAMVEVATTVDITETKEVLHEALSQGAGDHKVELHQALCGPVDDLSVSEDSSFLTVDAIDDEYEIVVSTPQKISDDTVETFEHGNRLFEEISDDAIIQFESGNIHSLNTIENQNHVTVMNDLSTAARSDSVTSQEEHSENEMNEMKFSTAAEAATSVSVTTVLDENINNDVSDASVDDTDVVQVAQSSYIVSRSLLDVQESPDDSFSSTDEIIEENNNSSEKSERDTRLRSDNSVADVDSSGTDEDHCLEYDQTPNVHQVASRRLNIAKKNTKNDFVNTVADVFENTLSSEDQDQDRLPGVEIVVENHESYDHNHVLSGLKDRRKKEKAALNTETSLHRKTSSDRRQLNIMSSTTPIGDAGNLLVEEDLKENGVVGKSESSDQLLPEATSHVQRANANETVSAYDNEVTETSRVEPNHRVKSRPRGYRLHQNIATAAASEDDKTRNNRSESRQSAKIDDVSRDRVSACDSFETRSERREKPVITVDDVAPPIGLMSNENGKTSPRKSRTVNSNGRGAPQRTRPGPMLSLSVNIGDYGHSDCVLVKQHRPNSDDGGEPAESVATSGDGRVKRPSGRRRLVRRDQRSSRSTATPGEKSPANVTCNFDQLRMNIVGGGLYNGEWQSRANNYSLSDIAHGKDKSTNASTNSERCIAVVGQPRQRPVSGSSFSRVSPSSSFDASSMSYGRHIADHSLSANGEQLGVFRQRSRLDRAAAQLVDAGRTLDHSSGHQHRHHLVNNGEVLDDGETRRRRLVIESKQNGRRGVIGRGVQTATTSVERGATEVGASIISVGGTPLRRRTVSPPPQSKANFNGNKVEGNNNSVTQITGDLLLSRHHPHTLPVTRQKSVSNSMNNPVGDPCNRKSPSDYSRPLSVGSNVGLIETSLERKSHRTLRILRLASSSCTPSSTTSSLTSVRRAPSVELTTVSCDNDRCPVVAMLANDNDMKRTKKKCHHCQTLYCSAACREADLERHSRTGCSIDGQLVNLCKRILRRVCDDHRLARHLAKTALDGSRSFDVDGGRRGCVLIALDNVEDAERFISGIDVDEAICYVLVEQLSMACSRWSSSELRSLCSEYDTQTRFIVCVAVVDNDRISGCVRSLRVRLPVATTSITSDDVFRPIRVSRTKTSSSENGANENDTPQTLILTAVPGCQATTAPMATEVENSDAAVSRRGREISFANVQRRLRQRGVSLRRQYPDVYAALCSYVADGRTFAPVSLFPVDAATGRSFMCVVMPDAEPQINWLDDENGNIDNDIGGGSHRGRLENIDRQRYKPEILRRAVENDNGTIV